jgi:hypothetical protein
MSGALVYLISAFLPYWLAKKAGQRIAGIFYLVVSLGMVCKTSACSPECETVTASMA